MVDSSSIPVHQHAANVKRVGEAAAAAGQISPARCMGRSRGELTTKIHVVVDANRNPVSRKLAEGQAHDGRSATDMLDTIGEGQILPADRAYDSDASRTVMTNRGAWANVKPMPHRVNIPACSTWLYRCRNLIERFFSAQTLKSGGHPI